MVWCVGPARRATAPTSSTHYIAFAERKISGISAIGAQSQRTDVRFGRTLASGPDGPEHEGQRDALLRIQDLAHLGCQALEREGLLQKSNAFVQHTVVGNDICRVPRDKQPLHVRVQG